MKESLEKILRDGFEYREHYNSYNGTCNVVGIKFNPDLELKLKNYFNSEGI